MALFTGSVRRVHFCSLDLSTQYDELPPSPALTHILFNIITDITILILSANTLCGFLPYFDSDA